MNKNNQQTNNHRCDYNKNCAKESDKTLQR